MAAGFASQADLANALREAGTGYGLPDRVQLGRQISTWETGKHLPAPLYRDLLCRVLRCTTADLLAGPDRPARPERALLPPDQVPLVLEELNRTLTGVRWIRTVVTAWLQAGDGEHR